MPKRRANGEGSLSKRKDKDGKVIMWQAQYIDNTGVRRTIYGKTQQIVKDKLKQAIRESDSGLRVDKSKMTFSAWVKEWLEVYSKPTVRESTYARYYSDYHNHISKFPNVTLKDLDVATLQRFFNEKAINGRIDNTGGLSINALDKIKKIMVMSLDAAVDNGMIARNVARKVKLPKDKKPDIEILTRDEQRRLEEVVLKDKYSLKFCIILALYTGLRIGELLALKIEDFNFEKRELYVTRSMIRVYRYDTEEDKSFKSIGTTKTKKGVRTIPLPDCIIPLVKDYIEERNRYVELMDGYWWNAKQDEKSPWVAQGFLFISREGTIPDQTYVRMLLKKCLEEAGIRQIKFHALRHTFASRSVEAGFNIKSLADILGHTDVKMTLNIYTHASEEQKRDNMNMLEMLSDTTESL